MFSLNVAKVSDNEVKVKLIPESKVLRFQTALNATFPMLFFYYCQPNDQLARHFFICTDVLWLIYRISDEKGSLLIPNVANR